MNRIMVVSPHPDDETLGAGGTLLKLREQKKDLFWLNITNMKTEYSYDLEKVKRRNAEIDEVKMRYGFDDFVNLELEPAGLEKYHFSDVYDYIAEFLMKNRPDTLILPYEHDSHSDHAMVFRWLYPFTKSFRYPFIKKVLIMEIVSETEFSSLEYAFKPNFFVDISEFIEKKIEIMNIYKSEMGGEIFPRSERNIRSLAGFRGCIAGSSYAEGFRVLKYID